MNRRSAIPGRLTSLPLIGRWVGAVYALGRQKIVMFFLRGFAHGRLAVVAVALIWACGGCGASDQAGEKALHSYLSGDYAGAEAVLTPAARNTNENFVLNNCRLGSAALAAQNLDTAETAFLAAYEVLNSVGTNDGGRTLGAVLVDEKLRIWRGEPYERAMANFYLGLVYYMQGEYNNARAAFENSLFKLRDYTETDGKEDDAYRPVESNFALGYLMLAKSWQRLGEPEKAESNFSRVRQLRSYLGGVADPAVNERSNLLLMVDIGFAPRKVTDFDGSIVGLRPTVQEAGPVPPPSLAIDGRGYDISPFAAPPVDLLALAQDRRWQSLDTFRAVKSGLGTGLIGVGAYEGLRSRNRSNQAAGLAMVGAGLLLKATSQADVRQWETLPRTTYVLPIRATPGVHDVTVQFPVQGLNQTFRGLTVPATGEKVYYLRMQRWQTVPRQMGPNGTDPAQPAPVPSPLAGQP